MVNTIFSVIKCKPPLIRGGFFIYRNDRLVIQRVTPPSIHDVVPIVVTMAVRIVIRISRAFFHIFLFMVNYNFFCLFCYYDNQDNLGPLGLGAWQTTTVFFMDYGFAYATVNQNQERSKMSCPEKR